MDLNNLIQIINKGKTKFDIEIYLVGGAVRDLLLGSNPTDLDFVFIDKQDNIQQFISDTFNPNNVCLLYTSPSPRDGLLSRMPYSA